MSEEIKFNHFAKDGEWIRPRLKYYYMGCCDCGLVHRKEFRLVPNKKGTKLHIVYRAWRDETQTKKLKAILKKRKKA